MDSTQKTIDDKSLSTQFSQLNMAEFPELSTSAPPPAQHPDDEGWSLIGGRRRNVQPATQPPVTHAEGFEIGATHHGRGGRAPSAGVGRAGRGGPSNRGGRHARGGRGGRRGSSSRGGCYGRGGRRGGRGGRGQGAFQTRSLPPVVDDKSLIKRVRNVHSDDIHGFVITQDRASQPIVVSGSKDCHVKAFSGSPGEHLGKLIHNIVAPHQSSYHRWITALDAWPDGSLLIGSRNGWLKCLGSVMPQRKSAVFYDGEPDMTLYDRQSPADSSKKKCYKKRNELRITGIKCLHEGSDYRALIGVTDRVLLYDFSSQQALASFEFAEPEWVYGFAPISHRHFLCIHAGTLSLFSHESFQPLSVMVSEPKVNKGEQRVFISSVYAVPKTNLCTLSCFGGITKVIDVQREGAVVHQGQEHKTGLQNYERVWQAQPVPGNPNEYASCADDGLVKLWDIRQPKSVRTIAGHPGRVSSMGFFSPHHVVVGSCPDDPHASPTKAELCFYDLRR